MVNKYHHIDILRDDGGIEMQFACLQLHECLELRRKYRCTPAEKILDTDVEEPDSATRKPGERRRGVADSNSDADVQLQVSKINDPEPPPSCRNRTQVLGSLAEGTALSKKRTSSGAETVEFEPQANGHRPDEPLPLSWSTLDHMGRNNQFFCMVDGVVQWKGQTREEMPRPYCRYYDDVKQVHRASEDLVCRRACSNRLGILEMKMEMHRTLNMELESKNGRHDGRPDVFVAMKVAAQLHSSCTASPPLMPHAGQSLNQKSFF